MILIWCHYPVSNDLGVSRDTDVTNFELRHLKLPILIFFVSITIFVVQTISGSPLNYRKLKVHKLSNTTFIICRKLFSSKTLKSRIQG